ncbi:hypothetical protein [Clostridium sp. YIM B02500]|uniref:hypothetical protein n=1 Tax=Clostridium sp. YIM B02500 TaxID=2910681 RepID=UPI001EEE8AB1|nr:hypothetical protein [Clostridium sp. YIM B02500]
MSVFTSILNLIKPDSVADANQTFNLKTFLNDNWDKLDTFAAKTITTDKLVNNLAATQTGFGLDATQGKAIQDEINTINSQLTTKANNTDNARTTTDKTVTGAINEINAKATQKATTIFNGDYTTVVNGTIALSSNITNQNKLIITFGGGLTKTWNKVITCSDAYPSNFVLNEIITVTFTNMSFVPASVSFQITSNNQLTVLDGSARLRIIQGII